MYVQPFWLKACYSVCSSCNNKRSSSVLEYKIPERLCWPWSPEHNSGQPVFANGASYDTCSSRRWSEWNRLHFSQHWGVYGIRAKWKFTGKWHIWRYSKTILCSVFSLLSPFLCALYCKGSWYDWFSVLTSLFLGGKWNLYLVKSMDIVSDALDVSYSWVWMVEREWGFLKDEGVRMWRWLNPL